MRRYRDRRPKTMFRGRELSRLMTMVVMLAVLGMLIFRARDPGTWRWLTGGGEAQREGEAQGEGEAPAEPRVREGEAPAEPREKGSGVRGQGSGKKASPPLAQTKPDVTGTDRDPEEASAAREEFQALSDRLALQPEEMPAYWRMVRWAQRQSLSAMQKRARDDLLFTHLVENPQKYRGQLIRVRLHVMRSLTYEPDKNPAGVRKLYEAWGWSDDSQPWPYVVVFENLPPGMPLGADVRAEVDFTGYFLKLMAYEAHDTKRRMAPLLVGRLAWREVEIPQQQDPAWFWPTIAGGSIVLIAVVAGWVLAYRSQRRAPQPERLVGAAGDAPIESWLEGNQPGELSDEIADDYTSGNGHTRRDGLGEPFRGLDAADEPD